MAQDPVNIGTVANDGTGDTLRVAFGKLNANDAELYALMAGGGETAAQILAKLITVDGAGSGLDADLLDGMSSAAFAAAVHAHAIADVTGLQAALDAKLPSASYTAADVLAKLLTVDGSGSGLDADLLDGQSSAAFAAASHTHAQSEITGLVAALASKLDAASYTAADVLAKLLTVDGAGSGIDADLLDGQSSAAFAQASHTHAIADVTGLQAALDGKGDFSSAVSVSVDSELVLFSGTTGKLAKRATGSGLATLAAGVLTLTDPATFAAAAHTHAIADTTGLQAALDAKLPSASYTAADVLAKLLTVDGAGSGLDADTLDGVSSAGFAAASHTHVIGDVTGLQAALDAKLASADYTAADVLAKLLTVDGSGSGLDADLLDGQSAAAFAAASHTHAQSEVTGLVAALAAKLDSSAYTAADVLSKLLTVDGATSGLDADLLDGISSAGYFQTASVLLAVDGTAGAPAYSFASDSDCGLLRIAANNIGLSVGATTVLDLTADTTLMNSASESPRLQVGSLTGTGATAINGITVAATTTSQIRLYARAAAAAMNLSRINGTSASPTVVLSGNNLAQVLAFGATNTTPTMASGAGFQMTATEDWSGSVRGCRLNLLSTATGTTTLSTTVIVLGTQAQFLDGTVSAPSITLQNDPDSGWYRIAANQLGLACNATNVLDCSTSLVAITATTLRLNTTSATTVGAAGGASALPATPLGYITANVNGTACKIPYYNT